MLLSHNQNFQQPHFIHIILNKKLKKTFNFYVMYVGGYGYGFSYFVGEKTLSNP